MRLKYTIVVHAGPFTSEASQTALRFTQACIDAGHSIYRVFFYQDGVLNGNQLLTPPQDEENLHSRWQYLQRAHNLELVVCIAAAARRGIIDESEANRHNKPMHNLPDGFVLSGLGQLVEATAMSDRVINFGASD